jgi:hypothetical protein
VRFRFLKFLPLVLILLGTARAVLADESVTDLAKKFQNPVSDLALLSVQDNINYNFGPLHKTQQILDIQPVIPIRLDPTWNLITRTTLPLISQPPEISGQNRKTGMGDLRFSALLSPAAPKSWIWGAGLIAQLDTATSDRLGQGKNCLGPAGVVLRIDREWVYGVLIHNLWSVSGDDSRVNVNQTTIQPIVDYNFPDRPGLYLTFSPVITADSEATQGNVWTVPLGLGIGRVVRLREMAINLQAAAYYNVIQPDTGADWQFQMQAALAFPN